MMQVLHPYSQFDHESEIIFATYEKYILNQKGGVIEGNNKYQYDFEIQDNQIFIGRQGFECIKVLIEDNNTKANIIFFGYKNECSVQKNLKRVTGTRHMFFWMMITILKYFPKITIFVLGDDTKILCNGSPIRTNNYYFLKYGKSYYELYYDFVPYFYYGENKYKNNLKKRLRININKKFIEETFEELEKKIHLTQEEKTYFLNLFGNCEEMKIIKFINSVSIEKKEKYCNLFFMIINKYYEDFFTGNPPQYFIYEVVDQKETITYLHEKITNIEN
jgi:hypothetical protein